MRPGRVQRCNTMNFRANSLQPVAGATGVTSRVQLPTPGRMAISLFENGGGRTLPVPAVAFVRGQQPANLARHQALHRAQCHANCMSKANF